MKSFQIHEEIEVSETLPGWVYGASEVFEKGKSAIFSRSWQLIETVDLLRQPATAMPFFFMEKYIDEALLLLHNDDGELRVMSNVCTHRGNILLDHPQKLSRSGIVCGYHGRRFDGCGKFISMPKTEGMKNFPTEKDNLAKLGLRRWRQFLFTSLEAEKAPDFDLFCQKLNEKVGFLPIEDFLPDASRSADYLVRANWALYCDNFLEGFHIPFVHPTLSETLNWSDYRTEISTFSNVQIGISKGAEHCFELPPDHPDFGQKIAGYYFWLWPNLMMNFYPWGLSINIVRPIEKDLTKVSFRSFIYDRAKLSVGAGGDLHRIEMEDEAIVENVQKGISSRFYDRGRYSPTMEKGVHHFHRLFAAAIRD